MGDEDLPTRIEGRPIPQRQELDDGTTVMKWRLEMSQLVSLPDLRRVSEAVSKESFSVTGNVIGPTQMLISIHCSPGISYTDLWDFSSRLLLTVEKVLGEIVSIEGT